VISAATGSSALDVGRKGPYSKHLSGTDKAIIAITLYLRELIRPFKDNFF